MESGQYIKYMVQTVNSYSKPVQRMLINTLYQKKIVTEKNQTKLGQQADIIDLNQRDVGSNKLAYALFKSTRALKEVEYWEFTKNYKYSIPCEIHNFNSAIIEKIKEAGAVEFDALSTQTDELPDSPSQPTILNTDSALFLKFSIKQDTYDPSTGEEEHRKRTIVLYILKAENYAEFRFDFISPYDNAKIYDISHYLEHIIDYLAMCCNLGLNFMELDGLIEKVAADESLNIIAQDMRMLDGSKAVLQASSRENENYVLPFLGELENILKEYSDDLEQVPKFREVLLKFVEEKKVTSDLPWVTIKWENGTDTKFTFNYKASGFCLVQHYCSYNPSDIGMERMNHVSEYIVRYRKLLTNKGNVK